MTPRRLEAAGRTASVWPARDSAAPLLCVLGEEGEAAGLTDGLEETSFHLVMLSGFDWHSDLTPWPARNPFRKGQDFRGGASQWLDLIANDLLPGAERALGLLPAWRGLAGYSLGGLFALWQALERPLFQRIASVNGSLWYEGFLAHMMCRRLPAVPERVYFSYGDGEAGTKLRDGQPLARLTGRAEQYFKEAGARTRLDVNPGSHFTDSAQRMRRAIGWLLR